MKGPRWGAGRHERIETAFDRVVPGERRAAIQCEHELAVRDARASSQDTGGLTRKRNCVLDPILGASCRQGPNLRVEIYPPPRQFGNFVPSLPGQNQKLNEPAISPFKGLRGLPY